MRNSACGWWLTGLSLILFASCDIVNPDESQPATIRLAPFQFQIAPGQGSGDNKITEAWMTANGNQIGVFAPPTEFPYYGEGSTRFILRPGIRNNGIVNDAIPYPLFLADTVTLQITPGQTYDIQPETRYVPGAVMSMIADFETSNDFIVNIDSVDGTAMVRSMNDVYEGQYAGEIVLTKESNFIEVTHALALNDLPTNGFRATYLEFRYKADVDFIIGLSGIPLTGEEFTQYFYQAKATDEWNMVYIELTDLLAASVLPSYKVVFTSQYPPLSTLPEVKLYFDNIKVVHN